MSFGGKDTGRRRGGKPYALLPNSEFQGFLSRESVRGSKFRGTKGKQPRSLAKVPKFRLSVKGSEIAKTARRLAQKQPSFKECVTAHWYSDFAPKI